MELRKCSKCGILKPLDYFQADKSKKSGYKSQCKECVKSNPKLIEYQKVYRQNHADYFRVKHSEYRARNREKLKYLSRMRRLNNPDITKRYYLENRERILERCHEYRKTERGKGLQYAYRVKRRFAMCAGDDDITLDKLFNRDGGVCALCGRRCDYGDYIFQGDTFIAGNDYPSIDHITPLSKGGSHTWNNVQLAHKRCNSIKSNR